MMEIRILFFHGGNGWWIAQCLDYDLCAQGRTIPDAEYEFQRTLAGQIMAEVAEGIEKPLSNVPKAPRRFLEMYDNARSRFFQTQSRHFTLPDNVPPAFLIDNFRLTARLYS